MSPGFLRLSHFAATVFFALTVSLVFAFLSKRTLRDRFIYFLWSFFAFLVIAIGIGWLMYPFSR